MNSFDRNLGKTFLSSVPSSPGIYRVYSAEAALIYVGKAKNLRRRLGQYRNAKRRKKHRKMQAIVSEAVRIEFQICRTELEARLLEAQLIQEYRPKWNIDGAFYFLYPMIGIQRGMHSVHLCFTARPEMYPEFSFHGAYRSHQRVKDAFVCLIELLSFLGHRLKPKRDLVKGYDRFGVLCAFQRIPEAWLDLLEDFLMGKSKIAIEELVLSLTENSMALKKKTQIQRDINAIRQFWKHDAMPLGKLIKWLGDQQGGCSYPISQRNRDLLFIQYRDVNSRGSRIKTSVSRKPLDQGFLLS